MSDSPADPPPWITGPPEGYDPPPVETLIDPEVQQQTAEVGRELVLAVLASKGRVKVGGKWTCTTSTNEGTER
jgi:hypothetical protein